MTSERQRKARWPGAALQDLVARWFRARVRLAQDIRVGEHAHWDPVNRTWQFHDHYRDRKSRRR